MIPTVKNEKSAKLLVQKRYIDLLHFLHYS